MGLYVNHKKKHKIPFNLVMIFLNLKERLYHSVSSIDANLIKKTGLFDHLSSDQFNKILHSVRLVRHPKNVLIFKENGLLGALYIIAEGAVCVFSHDIYGEKIPLAKLAKGDYFGEQEIIGSGANTANTNIETIESTILIRIDAGAIFPLWEENKELKIKLNKKGYEQAIHAFTSSYQSYNNIKPLIVYNEKNHILEFKKGEVIFNYGSKSENAYLILSGVVNLLIPGKHKEPQYLKLQQGHLFGELGVLENKPRKATATAGNNARLLVIKGSHFKDIYQNTAELKYLLSSLKHIYVLPLYGFVEEYISKTNEMGDALTGIFKLNSGESITFARSLDQDIFAISFDKIHAVEKNEYKYIKKANEFIKLTVANNYLIGIECFGHWDSLSLACQMLLYKELVSDAILEEFKSTGELIKKDSDEKIDVVCNCLLITKNTIQQYIDDGICDYDSLSQKTGAGTICGACKYRILEMLGENPWMSAIMQKNIQHNNYIYSYFIRPTDQKIKMFPPGQYIIVQTKIGDRWIERPYTMTSRWNENEVRITIKKEQKGLFTQWLFEQAREEINVNITQPQGFFILNKEATIPAICFAGGIGITPFLAYVKELESTKNNKRIHILYCALTKDDFIFVDEFNATCKTTPTITISYRSTDQCGLLSESEITNLIASFNEPDIYICGPEGFEKLIRKALQYIHYDQNKIHVEQFIHTEIPASGSQT